MREFLKMRFQWLQQLNPMRSQTLLVEGIPDELCTDTQVKHYFERAVGGAYVAQVALVKRVGADMQRMQREKDDALASLRLVQSQFAKTGGKTQLTEGGEQVDAATYYEDKAARLEESLGIARQNVFAFAGTENSGVCYNRGFVTFNRMSAVSTALNTTYNEDQDQWMVSAAPEPNDVQFNALMVGPREARVREFLGYVLVLIIFLIFLPLILWISGHTLSSELVDEIPYLSKFLKNKSYPAYAYDGLAGSLFVTVLMSIVPSILMLIFRQCFILRSSAETQLLCQKSYFYMLFVYVLLVISIGSSLEADAKILAKHPFAVFSLLASSLPESSHYYLNFVVFQCMAPMITLTRIVPLIKFHFYKNYGPDEFAHLRSDPEDQDYSGIGSRSARLTLIMVIALSFCTLSPLIVVLAMINFGICRVAYGYLVSYSETVKPECGGHLFASQMKHTQAGLVFYVVLMTGVLFQRAENSYPACISACAFVPLFWAIFRMDRAFKWQSLPVHLVKEDDGKPFQIVPGCYVQPELRPMHGAAPPSGFVI
jgi:hypothetical protein